jgi:hypothetical protein
MAAENGNGVTADTHARAGQQALVDGVADCGVGRARAFRAHVAFGGEAGEQVVTGGEDGVDGSLRDGFFDRLEVFISGVQEEVDVGVDQTGHEGAIAQVDGLRAGGMGYGGAGFNDAVALDEDFGGSGNFAGFNVQKAGGVEDFGGFWLCGG